MDRYVSDSLYDAWLASACMSPVRLASLLDAYGTPGDVYRAFMENRDAFRGILTPRIIQALRDNAGTDYLDRMNRALVKYSVGSVRISGEGYPPRLLDLEDPPAILFFRGDISVLSRKCVAMVGSRAASYTGQKAAARIAADLSRSGVTVVSGLAYGIDACAHRGCIDGGSPAAAVTGCGLDISYPAGNLRLMEEIISRGGVLLSEYAPGDKPAGWHFPVRNRIISGISEALVLIEARIRSGSMTTVQHALDQGKEVFVYPGDPDSEKFEGNHQLLREGGHYFTDAADILEDLNWLDNQSAVRQNSDCSSGNEENLAPAEKAVADALKRGVLGFEQLLSLTGLCSPELLGTLTVLQIRGLVEAVPGKRYQLKESQL